MKNEYEALRSRSYAYVFLTIGLLFFCVGLFFLIMWIEWSVTIVITSFSLFAVSLAMFIVLFLKQDIVIETNKEKIIFYLDVKKEYSFKEIESVYVKNGRFATIIIIKTSKGEENFECFLADATRKRVELIEHLEKKGIKINQASGNIK